MIKSMNSIKKSLVLFSQYSLGCPPTFEQRDIIRCLGKSISTAYTEQDEHLLVTLHSLVADQGTSYAQESYSRTGFWWKKALGFQHVDPTSDIRGGGLLSLENMIYFLANHPKASLGMIKLRANRQLTKENTLTSFPWACAGINLTRRLAREFEIISESGLPNIHDPKYNRKTSWHYLMEDNGFNRMYVCMFLLLDFFWDEMEATYMDFNNVMKAVSEEFSVLLALSSSLSNLENRVHERVKFIDPDIKDCTTLPEAPISPPVSNESAGSSLFDSFSSNAPSYQDIIGAIVCNSPFDEYVPDLLCGDDENDVYKGQHLRSMRRRTPYTAQIV